MRYEIARGTNAIELQKAVEANIAQGFRPYGSALNLGNEICQPMVLKGWWERLP